MTFGIIDLIVLAVIIISVSFALYRGLVRELLGISSWLLAGFIALYSYDPLLKLCEGHFQNVKLAAIISTIALALLVLIIMTIINAAITKRLRKSALSGLDRIFGLVFGIARALLIVALAYIFMAAMVLSPRQLDDLKGKNISISYIQTIAGFVEQIFPDNLRNDLTQYNNNQKQEITKRVKNRTEKKAKEAVAEYNEADRKSLDHMIEEIVEIGDIE